MEQIDPALIAKNTELVAEVLAGLQENLQGLTGVVEGLIERVAALEAAAEAPGSE